MKRIYATAFAVLSLAVCCSVAQPELTPEQQLAQRGIHPERYDYYMACPDVQHEQACDTLKLLIAAGADINVANNEGTTPLMVHARYNQSPLFIQLLEAGADINRRDNNGKTAADYAAEKFCHYNYARLHMAAAGKPELGHVTGLLHEMKWNQRYQPHDRSKTEQYLSELRSLLAAGADPNIPDWSGEPFIFQAVNYYYGNTGTQALEEVLKHGGDVHVRDKYGNTPLHSSSGNSTKLLLAAGADPNAVNNEGAPVITHVITEIIRRNPDDWQANICMADLTVKHLLAAGGNPNAADAQGNTALHYFLQGDDCAEVVNELIARGADINARNKDGATPLMLGATQDWSKTLASFLKNHTPNLNARDNRGLTAMHYAAEYAGCSPTTIAAAGGSTGNALEDAVLLNNIAEIERYIAAGGDVNVKGSHGSTLLHWAAACGHKKITSMLLQAGVNPNAKDNSDTTPLQLCFYLNYEVIRIHEECVRLLLDAGADPNVKARDSDELLIFSAARHSVVLELMLKKGISPDIKDSEGTPLIFHATSYRYAPSGPIKVLLNAGVDIFAKNAEGENVFEAGLIMEEPIFRTLDREREKRASQGDKK